MQILKESWKKEIEESIINCTFTEFTSSLNIAIRFIIICLDKAKTPFKVINLGAGVKKVTTKMDICPKCHGMGKV